MQRRHFILGDVVTYVGKNTNDGSEMLLEGRVIAVGEYYAYDLNRRDNGVRVVVENLPVDLEIIVGEDDPALNHKDPSVVEREHRADRVKGEVVRAFAGGAE